MMVLALLTLMFGNTTELKPRQPQFNIPEQIIETIVYVNNSSGVVVYSDETKALILTVNHVVEDELKIASCTGCNYNIKIKFLHLIGNIMPLKNWEVYDAVYVETNSIVDLALILIEPNKLLHYTSLSKKDPRLGEGIWIASNPNRTYRSLKKGIISSKNRMYETDRLWEVSGGIIYGGIGGGIFNMNGKLIGVARALELYRSKQCYLGFTGIRCISFPITDMGYVVPRFTIKEFLLNSSFNDHFNYLE